MWKTACLPWHAAQQCRQAEGFWGYTLYHSMSSNAWPEESFLWFLFNFLIFFWSLRGEIQKTWPSPYDLCNLVVKLSNLSLRRMVLGKWGLLFTCLEHKRNIRIFFWEYNSGKVTTGEHFLSCSGWLLPLEFVQFSWRSVLQANILCA